MEQVAISYLHGEGESDCSLVTGKSDGSKCWRCQTLVPILTRLQQAARDEAVQEERRRAVTSAEQLVRNTVHGALRAARDEGLEMAANVAEGLGPIDYTADSQAGGWNEALRQSAAAIRALSRAGKERG